MPILKTYLYSDVVRNGSVSAAYPSGFSPDSFDKSGAKACLVSAETSLPVDSYSLSWGASAVTVTSLKDTWTAGVSLFVSVPDVVNGQGEEVRSIVDPVTGGLEFSAAGRKARAIYDQTIPVLMLGGDHAYMQWAGTNGQNGMAQLYADRGIRPYLAVNTGPLNTATEDSVDYMSFAQVQAVSDRVDVIAHGHRHPQDWRLVNTGIVVRYTGAAATATVAITASAVSGVTTGGVDDFTYDITQSAYDTLAELVATIDALPNWTCTMSSELLGTELSTNLLVRAAADAKTANLYLCAGGGLLISNTGTTYRRLAVGCSGGSVSIYADGVSVYSVSLTGLSLSTLATAINALGGGITAEITNDAERNVNNFCSGSESATSITGSWSGRRHVGVDGLYLHAGLGHWYIVERQFKACVTIAANNGLTLRDFAQPGGGFYSNEPYGHGSFRLHRGNKKSGPSIAPNAFMRSSNFVHHNAAAQSYYPTPSAGRLTAVIEALADSPGYCVNLLMHNLLADGSSGYVFPTNHPSNYDQVESDWVAFLNAAKAAQSAGRIAILSQEEYHRSVPLNPSRQGNLLFNPRLKNSGETLIVSASDPGKIVPGWRLGALTANVSAASIDPDGFMTASITSGSPSLLQQVVNLPPGVYELRLQVPLLTYSSGEGFVLQVTSATPDFCTLLSDNPVPGQTTFSSIGALRGPGDASIRFSVSPPKPAAAEVRSKNAQTWNLSTNKNVRLNINNIGLTADIDCSAGASNAAAVTAKEVAAAINAGMAAQASYGAEYHSIAKAAAGKVIVTNPYVGSDRTHNVTISDGSITSATSTIFGGTCEGLPLLSDLSAFSGSPLTLGVSANFVGTVRFGAFSLHRVGDYA